MRAGPIGERELLLDRHVWLMMVSVGKVRCHPLRHAEMLVVRMHAH